MMNVWIISLASVALCGLALLPASLGVLKLTYKFAATSKGAFLLYRLAAPAYLISLALLSAALFLAFQQGNGQLVTLGAAGLVAGISIFGFFMHTSLMFKPVRKAMHISLDEAIKRFGEQEEVVGVLDSHGKPHAYIARLQRRPHIVYETQTESPFISTHCILAHSSMAYELSGDFSEPRICISSAVANNLVFYEKKRSRSYQQVYNSTTDGSQHLKSLPTVMTSLASWKRLYPESQVWIRLKEWRDTFYLKLLARASVIDPKSPDLVYPLQHELDTRLPLKAYVNGVSIGGENKAFALDLFHENRVVEDAVGNMPIVFFASPDADFVQLYSRKIGGEETARFRAAGEYQFEDLETGSTWSIDGRCTAGTLRGQKLAAIPHYNKIFWFCWADFFPSTTVYRAEPEMVANS